MKTWRINKYIAEEILIQTGLALGVLILVFMSGQLLEYTELIIRKGYPFFQLFYLLFLTLPALLVFTIPVAFLLGTMVGLSRLNADHEIVAMRALGLSLKRMSIPVWWVAGIVTMVTLLVTHYLMPYSNRKLRVTLEEMFLQQAFTQVVSHAFIQDFPHILLYINEVSSDQRTWVRPIMVDRSMVRKRTMVIALNAQVSQISENPPKIRIEFQKGQVYEFSYLKPEEYRMASFNKYVKVINLGSELNPQEFPKTDREMTLTELSAAIRKHWQTGSLAVAGYQVEYQKRWSFPSSALIFALIAFPLGVFPLRGGKFYGYAMSILIMLIAYIGILVGERLGDQAVIPPWLAAWNPHILLGVIGVVLFIRLDHPMKYTRSEKPKHVGSRILAAIFGSRDTLTRHLFRIGYILDRYILITTLRIFILTSLGLLPIFLIVEGFHLLDDLLLTHTPFQVLLKYLLVAAPAIYHQILPMIAMMTLMIVIAGLEKHREIMAMVTHGISYFRILAPLLFATMLITGLDYILQERIMPASQTRANAYKRIIKGRPATTPVAVQWAFGQQGYLYHFDAFDTTNAKMYGFDIYDINPETWSFREHCYAHEVSFVSPGDWRASRVRCRQFSGDFRVREFYTAKLRLPETPDYFESTQQTAEEMSMHQLRRYIIELRRKGFHTRVWEVDYVFKWIIPLSSLILFPLAASMAMYGARLGVAYGIVIAVLLGFGHWVLTQLGHTLGMVEALSPLEAALIPFVTTLFLGVFLFTRIRT